MKAETQSWGKAILFVAIPMIIIAGLACVLNLLQGPHLGTSARVAAAKTQIAAFKAALNDFNKDNGFYPKNLQALVQSPANAKNWNGPYMEKIPKDPWGNDYIYMCPGKHNPDGYDIICVGRDGVAGTDDDITSWALDD